MLLLQPTLSNSSMGTHRPSLNVHLLKISKANHHLCQTEFSCFAILLAAYCIPMHIICLLHECYMTTYYILLQSITWMLHDNLSYLYLFPWEPFCITVSSFYIKTVNISGDITLCSISDIVCFFTTNTVHTATELISHFSFSVISNLWFTLKCTWGFFLSFFSPTLI